MNQYDHFQTLESFLSKIDLAHIQWKTQTCFKNNNQPCKEDEFDTLILSLMQQYINSVDEHPYFHNQINILARVILELRQEYINLIIQFTKIRKLQRKNIFMTIKRKVVDIDKYITKTNTIINSCCFLMIKINKMICEYLIHMKYVPCCNQCNKLI